MKLNMFNHKFCKHDVPSPPPPAQPLKLASFPVSTLPVHFPVKRLFSPPTGVFRSPPPPTPVLCLFPSCHSHGAQRKPRSSSREVRIRVPFVFFSVVYFSRGTLSQKRNGKRALQGDLEIQRSPRQPRAKGAAPGAATTPRPPPAARRRRGSRAAPRR